jgi:hypothetical protein
MRERDALKDELEVARQLSARERDALSDELELAREAVRERDALRDELESARAAVSERDALRAELQAAQAAHEQRDAARALHLVPHLSAIDDENGEEMVVDLTTDTKDHEMERAYNRIRSLELALRDAETRAESAELELELQRRRAPSLLETPIAEVPEPAAVPEAKEPVFRGPARGAKRVAMASQVDIQIDGTDGKLIDLSVTGAQVLTAFSMKPNRLVKVTLPMSDSMIACKAKVMWSKLEPKAGQFWYRAGVSFTSADQIALEAFMSTHKQEA